MVVNPYAKRFLLWVFWLSAGCLFYAINLNISYSKSIYYSVLVGYNIGWNFEEDTDELTDYYSIAHMILGVCAVTFLLQEYVEHILVTDTHWYKDVIRREQYMDAVNKKNVCGRIYHGFLLYKHTVVPLLIWFVMWGGGSGAAYLYTTWDLRESCFFTISTLFAGGFAQVPDDFTNFQYLCGMFTVAFSIIKVDRMTPTASLFAALGVPLTIYCFSSIVTCVVSSPHSSKFQTVCKTCTIHDLKMMQDLNLENCDGHLDKAEYIILCMLRLRAIEPDLVEAIDKQYKLLDTSDNGLIEYTELLKMNEADVRLHSSIRGMDRENKDATPRVGNSKSEQIADINRVNMRELDDVTDVVLPSESNESKSYVKTPMNLYEKDFSPRGCSRQFNRSDLATSPTSSQNGFEDNLSQYPPLRYTSSVSEAYRYRHQTNDRLSSRSMSAGILLAQRVASLKKEMQSKNGFD